MRKPTIDDTIFLLSVGYIVCHALDLIVDLQPNLSCILWVLHVRDLVVNVLNWESRGRVHEPARTEVSVQMYEQKP